MHDTAREPAGASPTDTGGSASPAIALDVELPATLAAGARATFTVVATNRAAGAITLYLVGRAPTVELRIERHDEVLWNSLAKEAVPQIVAVYALAPGESIRIPVAWPGTRAGGVALEPGAYQLRATLLTEAVPRLAITRPLRIVARK